MTESSRWMDGGKSANWAVLMLPLLVRQARNETPITYQAISRELGMAHHRPVQKAAERIGEALNTLGKKAGWKKRPPPPIQSMIVNKETGLPGDGVDGFMTRQWRTATNRQRASLLKGIYSTISAYPHWEEVMSKLAVNAAAANADDVTTAAIKGGQGGGEGPEHLALKNLVLKNPGMVGLSGTDLSGLAEQPLPSGDRLDILFSDAASDVAVEVKPDGAPYGDVARGIYQCVKYRAVMEAASRVSFEQRDVRVVLALGGKIPGELRRLVNAFDITVFTELKLIG